MSTISVYLRDTFDGTEVELLSRVLFVLNHTPIRATVEHGYVSFQETSFMVPLTELGNDVVVSSTEPTANNLSSTIDWVGVFVDLLKANRASVSPFLWILTVNSDHFDRSSVARKCVVAGQSYVKNIMHPPSIFIDLLRCGRPDLQLFVSKVYVYLLTKLKERGAVQAFLESLTKEPWDVRSKTVACRQLAYILTHAAVITRTVESREDATFVIDNAAFVSLHDRDAVLIALLWMFSSQALVVATETPLSHKDVWNLLPLQLSLSVQTYLS